MVIEPVLSAFVIVMLWSSWLTTVHPEGNVNATPALDAVPLPVVPGVGLPTGLGVPAGLGLGRSPAPWLLPVLRLPNTASAVPHPAMSSTSTTIAAMISVHGVRCTGGCGPTALGA